MLDVEDAGLVAEEQPARATAPIARAPASMREEWVIGVMAASLGQPEYHRASCRCTAGEALVKK